MKAKVTVVIPFYNPGAYLIESIQSVFDQTLQDWQLLLVNDASTDDSLSLVQPYLNDPRVKVIENKDNLGQSRSLNAGLEHVETEYFIQLDADDWFTPNALKVLVKESKKVREDVAVISGNIFIVVEDKNGNVKKQIKKKGRKFRDKYDFMLSNLSVWPRFYRTSALKTVGGWPTDDPYQGRLNEDKRVLFRLVEHYHFHWINKALYYHRLHGENQTNDEASYRIITKWTIEDTLRRWGDEYRPVFEEEHGWLFIKDLKRKN